jgi:hypothetical protein
MGQHGQQPCTPGCRVHGGALWGPASLMHQQQHLLVFWAGSSPLQVAGGLLAGAAVDTRHAPSAGPIWICPSPVWP